MWRGQVRTLLQRMIPKQSNPIGDSGFALIVVIWGIGLLAIIASTFVTSAHTQTKASLNRAKRVQAETLADGGVYLAIAKLVRGNRGRAEIAWLRGNGVQYHCKLPGNGALSLTVRDEAGKIDLNAGTDDLLRSLFVGLAMPSDDAAKFTDRIVDFRDGDDLRRLNGAEAKEYAAGGLPYGPKNARFDLVEELEQVIGIPTLFYERVKPMLTVYSGRNGVDPSTASVTLKEALSKDGGEIPRRFIAPSPRRTFTIESNVALLTDIGFRRVATVELLSGGNGYKILRWTTGRRVDQARRDGRIPDC